MRIWLTTRHAPVLRMKNAETSQILALEALGFIAADAQRLDRFLLTTGLDAQQIGEFAGDGAFQGGVLDYLLGDEPLLLAFAEHADVRPEAVARARFQLPGATDAA
jgi:Protein of unknown function (DUF3572)